MPFQNRVAPTGALHAVPSKGTLMVNRGILHDADGRIVRTHAHCNWVTCALQVKGRKQSLMAPGHYTQLFFLDEATALAAGHRPCATCRRSRYRSFVDAWCDVHGPPTGGGSAPQAIDRALHVARISRQRGKIIFRERLADLPNGTILADPDGPILIWDGAFLRWSFAGYHPIDSNLPEEVSVLTPKPLVELYAAGWVPDMRA
jgi:hypothetical protein